MEPPSLQSLAQLSQLSVRWSYSGGGGGHPGTLSVCHCQSVRPSPTSSGPTDLSPSPTPLQSLQIYWKDDVVTLEIIYNDL